MKIETKYNIGDEVWFMDRDQPKKAKITLIVFRAWYKGQLTHYCIDYNNNYYMVEFREERLFPTKEELLKSL